MVIERSEYKAYGFWFLFEKFYKDLKRFNVKKVTSSCAIVLLYWLYVIAAGRSLFSLHFASRMFQNQILLRIGSSNNGPKQSKIT